MEHIGEKAAVRMCCFRAKVAVRPAQDGFLWAHLQSLSTSISVFFSVSSLILAVLVSRLNLGGSSRPCHCMHVRALFSLFSFSGQKKKDVLSCGSALVEKKPHMSTATKVKLVDHSVCSGTNDLVELVGSCYWYWLLILQIKRWRIILYLLVMCIINSRTCR